MAYDETLAQRVRGLLSGMPMLVEKKMFGGTAFLLQGNMACGVHGDNLIVRIDPQETEAVLAQPNVCVFNLTGKPMKGWILITPEGTRQDPPLAEWVEKGVAFARSLTPK